MLTLSPKAIVWSRSLFRCYIFLAFTTCAASHGNSKSHEIFEKMCALFPGISAKHNRPIHFVFLPDSCMSQEGSLSNHQQSIFKYLDITFLKAQDFSTGSSLLAATAGISYPLLRGWWWWRGGRGGEAEIFFLNTNWK